MKNDLIRKQLKNYVHEYADTYAAMADNCFKRRCAMLRPGQPAPARDLPLDRESREEFGEVCADLRRKVNDLLDGVAENYTAEVTKAPSDEAVKLITVLKAVGTVSEGDLAAYLEKYGDNYTVYVALREIAKNSGIILEDPPVVKRREAVEDLRQELTRSICISDAERGGTGKGYIAAIEMDIDMKLAE